MASKKKTNADTAEKRYFVLSDGTRYEMTGEDGKYVYCGATQFRRMRGEIVTEKVAETPAEEAE